MKTISHHDLMHDGPAVLRRVEAGERLVIIRQGQPVAVLEPFEHRRQWGSAASVREMLATPSDPTVLEDLRNAALASE